MARAIKTAGSSAKAMAAPVRRGSGSAPKPGRGTRTKAAVASVPPPSAKSVPVPKSRGKAAPAQPAKPVVITMKQLAGTLSESRNVPRREAAGLVAALVETVVAHVKDGAKVRIAGLGVLEVKDRPARMARNPATGEQVHVAASRKVAFRPAKNLKESI